MSAETNQICHSIGHNFQMYYDVKEKNSFAFCTKCGQIIALQVPKTEKEN